VEETVFLKDREWSVIDGEVCRATVFDDTNSHRNMFSPYAVITIECKKIPNKINGYITHKVDLMHLRNAFKERPLKEDEEVLTIWTKKHYKNVLFKLSSFFMPKLIVWICKKGAYELINYPNHKPGLQGEARFLAQRPIIEWKPKVME